MRFMGSDDTGQPFAVFTGMDLETIDEVYSLRDFREEFRNNALVKQSILLLATMATKGGFKTQVVAIREGVNPSDEKYQEVKRQVDKNNQLMNLDFALYVGDIKRKIYGIAAFEIVGSTGGNKWFELLPLSSEIIKPIISQNYNLEGWEYAYAEGGKYEPNQVFYLLETSLEKSFKGISTIEPIMQTLATRKNLWFDIKEAGKRLWAPILLCEMDTSGLSKEKAQQAMSDFSAQLKPGRNIVYNRSVKIQAVSLTPDISSLLQAIDKCDEDIMGNYSIPRALLGREKTTNRATLEYSIKTVYDVSVTGAQRYIANAVEDQLYTPQVEDAGYEDDIRIKHVWNPLTLLDLITLAGPIVKLFEAGAIDVLKAWELLGFDVSLMPEDLKNPAQTNLEGLVTKENEITEEGS